MKKFLKIIIFLFILGVLWYQYQDIIRARLKPVFNEIVARLGFLDEPCEEPISYALGSFDARFGISKDYFLSALADAEETWEKPYGKELFTSGADADANILKINLIYDYRQQATTKLQSLGVVVADNKASYDSLKIKFTELKTRFTIAKNTYDARVASFNRRQKAYEKQVEYWNAQGGAPKKEYEELQAEQSALNREASQLENSQEQINEMVEEINALVVVLNRLASSLNISVDKYNTIGASRGESFEEGVFSSDGFNREIDIYEFSSRAKLVRVLAHELGHALGLEHVEDPKAIMYRLNQGNNETLTTADLDALKAQCKEK